MLLSTLPHSGRTRGRAAAFRTDQPHLVEGIDGVLRRLGGTARRWRVDRTATVIVPGVLTSRRASPRWPSTTVRSWWLARPDGGTGRGRWKPRLRFATGRWWRPLTVTLANPKTFAFDVGAGAAPQ